MAADVPRTITTTRSLCPDCFQVLDAAYKEIDGTVHLERTCPEHGTVSPPVWASAEHHAWAADYAPARPSKDTFSLNVVNQHACLAVVEVTERCNLECPYCFAGSGPVGKQRTREEILHLLDVVAANGGPRPIQFSGGEPTIHPELIDLVSEARDRGFQHVEVNTNGVRLAKEPGYAQALKEAGVTAIYLQFDGFEKATNEAVRATDLRAIKAHAMEACGQADLPVILVCTIVKGVNDHELGAIIQYALDNRDVVGSINFQPVAHFGRYQEDSGLLSLDAVARLIEEQTGWLQERDFLPVPCCSAYCQAATAVLPTEEGGLPLTRFVSDEMWDELSGLVDEADWMELLAGTPEAEDRTAFIASCCSVELPEDAAELMAEVMPIGLTGFMDADAADLDRLAECCIAVPTPEAGLVPFCAYNMTTRDGEYKLRNLEGWGGRDRAT